MQSYKILYNTNFSKTLNKSFTTYLEDNTVSYINGKHRQSIAIEYNPEHLKELSKKYNFYEKMSSCKIEQTIVTDQKFAFLICNTAKLNLKFINCTFNTGDEKELIFDEDNKISKEILKDLILDPLISFEKTTFFDFEAHRIIVTKNGIIYFEKYNKEIPLLIDTINLGEKALDHEENI